MIPFDEARAIVAAVPALAAERLGLIAAEGRTLAERIVARDDLVPFARSAMDGFAVCAADTSDAPVPLRIAAAVYAEAGAIAHTPRTATAIATGGAIPAGADAVIPIEDTIVMADGIVVANPVVAGHHVFPAGEDARAGDELAAAGSALNAGALGLLAAAGVRDVLVYRLPRVAILASGNELVRHDETPVHGQVRDSNSISIAAALRGFGVASIEMTSAVDDPASVRATLARALDAADLVVVSGGASVGERDYVKAACDALGVTFDFRAVALRPARPSGFGRRGAAIVTVVPGNPASAFVALHEFVRPAIAALGGRTDGRMVRVSAALDGSLHARKGRSLAAYARVRYRDGGFVATPLGNQCSALTRLAADSDGFIIVDPDADDLDAGDRVDVDIVAWDRVFTIADSR
jgi:molybdopterin molybdotransferase